MIPQSCLPGSGRALCWATAIPYTVNKIGSDFKKRMDEWKQLQFAFLLMLTTLFENRNSVGLFCFSRAYHGKCSEHIVEDGF